MNFIRAASVQFQHQPGDKPANLAIIRRFVEHAAAQDVKLLVFPECCVSGYWHLRNLSRDQMLDLAEAAPRGPICQTLLEWAAEFNLSIGAGFIERDENNHLYNSYFLAMPDGRHALHRKLHAFVSPHLTNGDRFTVADLPDGTRIGILICYDNNLVENVRCTALAGAEILLAPHQTGGCRTLSPHGMKPIDPELWNRRHEDPAVVEAEFRSDKGRGWLMRWLPSRAHDNGIFLIFSNGVGQDDDEVRTGNAMILDPYGRILAETSQPADAIIIADLDPALRENATGARWLLARRPELYAPLIQLTGAERPIREVRFGVT